mgnify:FL=1
MSRYWNDTMLIDDTLAHYGVLGMKWGVRRYQNTNGTLTSAGKKRYSRSDARQIKKNEKLAIKTRKQQAKEIKKSRKNDARYSSTLSSNDIDKRIDRLKKEKQLRDLTRDVDSPAKSAIYNSIQANGSKILGGLAAAGMLAVGTSLIPEMLRKNGHPNGGKIVEEIVRKAEKIAFPKK